MDSNLSFATIKDKIPALSDDYCSFNGTSSLISKKKYNFKYYVYNKKTGDKVVLPHIAPMSIIQTLMYKFKNTDEIIALYVDTYNRLSFVRIRKSHNRDIDKIVEKVEKTPFSRSLAFSFFSVFFFVGVLRLRNYSYNDAYISLGYDKSINKKIHFIFPKSIRKKIALNTNKFSLLIHSFWTVVPIKEIYKMYLVNSEINVPVFIKISQTSYNFWYPFKSNYKHGYNRSHYLFNTVSIKVRKTNNELFIRKSITGQYVIVVTSLMSKLILIKEKLAYFVSLLFRNKEIYDVYFEKFSQGASESGFELFKYAYEKNKKSVYILDRNYHIFKELKKKFGKNLAAKNSIRAFLYTFLARSFQSSDMVSHIQRRLYDNDKLVKKKILSCNKKIMLQHGVCMCTNIFERGYFNRKVPITSDYILVNSNYERDLFIKNTGYKKKDLIVTGLPNLDLYVKERETKKQDITFMLTWRPWDLTGKIGKGSYIDRYFSFLELIRTNDFYNGKKVNLILHPKSRIILEEQFPELFKKISDYLYIGDIKEALLKSKVVISDYSSIIYFAFAGGSNIVHYWEDKEFAEEQYGSKNILQKEIAFGDIVYKLENLQESIEKNYTSEQLRNYIDKYNILVNETSGMNTKNTYDYINTCILNTKNKKELTTSDQLLEINPI